jgi:hypothetical protein
LLGFFKTQTHRLFAVVGLDGALLGGLIFILRVGVDFRVFIGCSGGACSSSEKSKRGLLLVVIVSFWV